MQQNEQHPHKNSNNNDDLDPQHGNKQKNDFRFAKSIHSFRSNLLADAITMLQARSGSSVDAMSICCLSSIALTSMVGASTMLSKLCWMSMTVCWDFAFYSDELCAGNPLAASTNRKCWAIYAGFKEMGPVLSNEFAWITICILRSTVVAGLEANMSQVMKKVLLQPPEQHAGEKHRKVKLYLSFFVQDGQAQKMTWPVEGDSGSRFCSLCSNCFSHMTDEDGVGAGCDFICHAQLAQHSSQEMFASWDRMQVRYNTCNAGEWKRRQQATGITYSPEALMACPELRHLLDPVTQWTHDYMHCLLSNGLMAYAIFNLLEALSCWQSSYDYTKFWKMPKQFSGINICQVFDKKRFGRV